MTLSSCIQAAVVVYLALALPYVVIATDHKQTNSFSVEDAEPKASNTVGTVLGYDQIPFSPIEWTGCRAALRNCLNKLERGTLSLDDWTAFIERGFGGEETPDGVIEELHSYLQQGSRQVSFSDALDELENITVIGELRSVLHDVRQVNLAFTFDEMKSNMTRTEILRVIGSMGALADNIRQREIVLRQGGGKVSEKNLCPLKEQVEDSFVQFLFGDFLQYTDAVRAVGIELAWAGLAVFRLSLALYVKTCGFASARMPPFDSLVGYFVQLRRSLRRRFTGSQLLRSSTACESQLLSCRQDIFLLESLPEMFKAAFFNAGHNS